MYFLVLICYILGIQCRVHSIINNVSSVTYASSYQSLLFIICNYFKYSKNLSDVFMTEMQV